MFSVQIGRLSADEGLERPLQDRGPIKIPFIFRHHIYPFAIIIYGTRGGSSDLFALVEARSKVWPISGWIEWLPPENISQSPPSESEWESGKLARNCGSGMRKSP